MRGVRPNLIVILAPALDDEPGFSQAGEHFLVQALVPQPTVEALREPVLLRLARRDVVPINAGAVAGRPNRPLRDPASAGAETAEPILTVAPRVRSHWEPFQPIAHGALEEALSWLQRAGCGSGGSLVHLPDLHSRDAAARSRGWSCFSPLATIERSALGSGRCKCNASPMGAVSQASHSWGVVRMTGIALGWTGATTALASQVRKANNSCAPSIGSALVRIPTEASRAFRRKPAGDSDGSQPPIPRQTSHP